LYLYIIFSILVLLLFIAFLPLKFSFMYTKEDQDENGVVSLKFFPGIGYQVRILEAKSEVISLHSQVKIAHDLLDEEVHEMGPQDILGIYQGLKEHVSRYDVLSGLLYLFLYGKWPEEDLMARPGGMLLQIILGAVNMGGRCCEKFHWSSNVGFGDAAITAISAGLLWNVKSFILAGISARVKFIGSQPHIEVVPDFSKERFDTSIHCIFLLRIGHIIFVGLFNVVRAILQRGTEFLRAALNLI
jgi:hypothetical protein